MVSKRRRIQISRLDVSFKVQLDTMSGKVYEIYPKTVEDGGTAKKKDDAPVNAGLSYSFSLE